MKCSLLPLPQLKPSIHRDALPTLHLMREERRQKRGAGLIWAGDIFLLYQNYDSQNRRWALISAQFDQGCFLISVRYKSVAHIYTHSDSQSTFDFYLKTDDCHLLLYCSRCINETFETELVDLVSRPHLTPPIPLPFSPKSTKAAVIQSISGAALCCGSHDVSEAAVLLWQASLQTAWVAC